MLRFSYRLKPEDGKWISHHVIIMHTLLKIKLIVVEKLREFQICK